MSTEQINDIPDFPVIYDVLGGAAFAAFVASAVVERTAARRVLRCVAILTGVPALVKNYQHNEHYKQDLTGLGLPAPDA